MCPTTMNQRIARCLRACVFGALLMSLPGGCPTGGDPDLIDAIPPIGDQGGLTGNGGSGDPASQSGLDTGTWSAGDGVAGASEEPSQIGPPVPIAYAGTFQRLLDTDSLPQTQGCDFEPALSAMSRDGRRVAFFGRDGESRYLFLMDYDGTNISRYSLHMFRDGLVTEITMSRDGSAVYLLGPALTNQQNPVRILKVDNGTTLGIRDDSVDGVGIAGIQTTGDGKFLFFQDSRNIYRIRHDGTDFLKVVVDADVPTSPGPDRFWIGDFAISEDGHVIAFELERYWDIRGWRTDEEIFVQVGGPAGRYRQLTSDGPGSRKDGLAISPDGSTVAYCALSPTTWHRIQSDGSEHIVLSELTGSDPVQFTDSGMTLFHNELVRYEGGAMLDPLPRALEAVYPLSVSGDGVQMAFVHRYRSTPTNGYALYMGWLVRNSLLTHVPQFEELTLDPQRIAHSGTPTQFRITAEVTDADGLADIDYVETSELVDGRLKSVGYFWNKDLRDHGTDPDREANDGIFSGESNRATTDHITQFRVRVEARDNAGHFGVADVLVPVGS